jgi:hypothetical protein
VCEPTSILALTSALSAGIGVKGVIDQNKAPTPKPPQLPKVPQAPKAPDQTLTRENNRDAALRSGIASTFKSPLGGVPVGSLNLGSARLLGG